MKKLINFVVVVGLVFFGYAFFVGEHGDVCASARARASAEVPHAVDLLAAEHPLKVGLLRQVLDPDGTQSEKLARRVLEENEGDPGPLACAMAQVRIAANPDAVRREMADRLAAELGL